jgi:hypothetical protein
MRSTPDRHNTRIYLANVEHRELLAWAKAEGRSISNLVGFVLRQALAARNAGTGEADRQHPAAKVQRQ